MAGQTGYQVSQQQMMQIRQQIQQFMSQLPPQQQQQARRVFAPMLAAMSRAPGMMNRPMSAGQRRHDSETYAYGEAHVPTEQVTGSVAMGGRGGSNQRLEQMMTQALAQMNLVSNQLAQLQAQSQAQALASSSGRGTSSYSFGNDHAHNHETYHHGGHFRSIEDTETPSEEQAAQE